MNNNATELIHKAVKARYLRLFLDYDGTLADFAPSPDTLLPDLELIALVKRLVNTKGILPAIISGRKLEHISKLLPVKGLLLGGTYGIEIKLPDGQYWSAMDFQEVRPIIEHILPLWKKLIENKNGFYLEDKGWSLALHGGFANETDAKDVLDAAHKIIEELKPDSRFRLYDGELFLEYAPSLASKTIAAQWVIDNFNPKGALNIFIGDDEKDEEAFSVVKKSGGFSVKVSANSCETNADLILKNPIETRNWLQELLLVRGT